MRCHVHGTAIASDPESAQALRQLDVGSVQTQRRNEADTAQK